MRIPGEPFLPGPPGQHHAFAVLIDVLPGAPDLRLCAAQNPLIFNGNHAISETSLRQEAFRDFFWTSSSAFELLEVTRGRMCAIRPKADTRSGRFRTPFRSNPDRLPAESGHPEVAPG